MSKTLIALAVAALLALPAAPSFASGGSTAAPTVATGHHAKATAGKHGKKKHHKGKKHHKNKNKKHKHGAAKK
jgi:hypothetical protein